MTTPTIPVRLGKLARNQNIPTAAIANACGVTVHAVRYWAAGTRTPMVTHTTTFARLVGQQLVVRRGGLILGDAADFLPWLHGFRLAAGLSQNALRNRLHVSSSTTVSGVETRARREDPIGLPTLQTYLAGCGYQVDLAAAEMAVAT